MRFLLFTLFLVSISYTTYSYGYDTCKDKNIEFCIEEDKTPVFDYEPKKVKRKVVKRKKVPAKKKFVLDTSTGFKRGEIDKEVEMLGYSGSGAYQTISTEGFNPDKDYFIEDKSGPNEIFIDGSKVRVRKISRGSYKGADMKPSGVVTASGGSLVAAKGGTIQTKKSGNNQVIYSTPADPSKGEVANIAKASVRQPAPDEIVETTYKRVFTTDESGKIVSKKVKVTTYRKKKIATRKGFWEKINTRYESFKKDVFLPKYNKAKTKIKNMFHSFFGRKK